MTNKKRTNSAGSNCIITHGIEYSSTSNNDTLNSCIINHPFNAHLEIITIENTWQNELKEKISNSVSSLFGNQPSYQVFSGTGTLLNLLDQRFINTFVKNNSAIVLSFPSSKGFIDSFALYNGILHINLSEETYLKSGLTESAGSSSSSKSKTPYAANQKKRMQPRSHHIIFNLRSHHMIPGNSGYDRLLWSAENVLNFKFNIRISLLDRSERPYTNNHENEMDNLSFLKSIFGDSIQNFTCNYAKSTVLNTQLVPSFECPGSSKNFLFNSKFNYKKSRTGSNQYSSVQLEKEIQTEWQMHIYEWLALVSLEAASIFPSMNPQINLSDPFLSQYSIIKKSDYEYLHKSENQNKKTSNTYISKNSNMDQSNSQNQKNTSIIKIEWNGLISSQIILDIWKAIIEANPTTWIALNVSGFSHSPISWKDYYHHPISGNGENNYTIVKPFPNSLKYLLYQTVAEDDNYV